MNLEKVEDFLEYYHRKYKTKFRVQVFYDKPIRWYNYKELGYNSYVGTYGEPNHREILPTEIVLDTDYHSKDATKEQEKKALKTTIDELKKRLEEKNLTYSLWKSGGSGYHFHLFFEDLSPFGRYERDELKRLIIRHICYGFLTHHEDRAHVHLPTMIQIEKRKSRKGGIKELVEFKDFGSNTIPADVMVNYDVDKALEKYIIKSTPLTNGEPSSIRYLLSNDFANQDGKKRACFVLASWYAQQGKPIEDTFAKLAEWNSYTLRGYLTKKAIKSTVESVYKSKRRVSSRYRNSLLKELGAEKFME